MTETDSTSRTVEFVRALVLSPTSPPRPDFVARLFRIPKPEAGMQAVEARLATEPWASLSREALVEELRRWNVRPAQVEKPSLALFRRAVSLAIRDLSAGEEVARALDQLANLLGVDSTASEQVKLAAAEVRYRQVLTEAVTDRCLTDEERGALARLAEGLQLRQERLEVIHRDVLGRAVQQLFNEQTADRRFSPDEEAELRRVAENLRVELTFDDTSRGLIHRYRQFWEIDQGRLPSLDVPVRLQRGEVCHWCGFGRLNEYRSVTTRVGYSGPTARIRIARGLSWRMGSLAVSRVTQDVLKELDSGTCYVTSKRLIFNGSKKTTALPLRRILNFTIYQDGVQIEKDSGKDQYFRFDEFDGELLGAILDAAIDRSGGA